MNWIIKVIISSISVLIAAFLLPGVEVEGFLTAILVAVVLSILNAVVRPILVIFTIPITIFTLGLFLLIINAIIIQLADWVVDGFEVNGWIWAILFSLLVTFINSILEGMAKEEENK